MKESNKVIKHPVWEVIGRPWEGGWEMPEVKELPTERTAGAALPCWPTAPSFMQMTSLHPHNNPRAGTVIVLLF